jgi:hypothetical protein
MLSAPEEALPARKIVVPAADSIYYIFSDR